MPLGLIALAVGAFGIGLTEFVIMGLLPEVATDFAVSESAAGWLISGYALSVVVGALGLTAATTRLPRKPVLLGLIVLFILGNALTALAPDYGIAMIGRIIAALCHGAFFGIGAVVAAGLVAPEKKAGAIALMFTGLTAANVFGVPFGTFLGQQFGWRSTFWVIAGIGILAFIGILTLVPKLPRPDAAVRLRHELRAFRSGQVWVSLAVTVLAYGGMFGGFTYIAYTLTEVSGFDSGAVPWLLVLFGIGLVIGNAVGGRLADRSIDGTLLVAVSVLFVVLIAFAALATSGIATIVALFLMGRVRLRDGPGAAEPHDGLRRLGADARVGRQHRRLQRRERAGGLGRRHRDRGGSRVYVSAVDRRGDHRGRHRRARCRRRAAAALHDGGVRPARRRRR